MDCFAKREETMNCKVQKYRVLVMGLLILSLMGLSGCGRQESTANVPKLKDPVGVDVDTAKVKKMNCCNRATVRH